MSNSQMKYFVTTYSHFSHNYLIASLSTTEAQYRYDMIQNEEVFSKFIVLSDSNVYNMIKQLMENNDGTAISIEYGPN